MTTGKPINLGDIIEAYCSRCRLNLDCNVAAVQDGQPLKIQCRTCWNIVAYKPPADLEAKRDKSLKQLLRLQEKKHKEELKQAGRSAPILPSAEREEWEKLTEGFDLRYARPYDRQRRYADGDFVLHKKLGVGVVESSDTTGESMVVLFKDGRVGLEQNKLPEE